MGAGCGGGGGDGGADAVESMVLETCAPGSDPVETEVCRCAYRAIEERYDSDALRDLDRRLRDDPETVTPEIREVVLDCAFDVVAPPTSEPEATATSRSTASTTSSTATTERRGTTTSTTRRP